MLKQVLVFLTGSSAHWGSNNKSNLIPLLVEGKLVVHVSECVGPMHHRDHPRAFCAFEFFLWRL